jgi:haloacetate dehalogenase
MLQAFTSARVDIAGAAINPRRGGEAPPLLPLHGCPRTSAIWHGLAPALTERVTGISADLRGCGDSAIPPANDDHWRHSRQAAAADQIEMLRHLGRPGFFARPPGVFHA